MLLFLNFLLVYININFDKICKLLFFQLQIIKFDII